MFCVTPGVAVGCLSAEDLIRYCPYVAENQFSCAPAPRHCLRRELRRLIVQEKSRRNASRTCRLSPYLGC